MSARFRIRSAQGQELSFASHDVFVEFVRSGDLAPDDVVYDAETREWSPARTHPVVLQIELEAEETAEAAAKPADDDEDSIAMEDLAPRPPARDIGLDLAPAPDLLTPEQEAQQFIGQMAAERAADLDQTQETPIVGFTMEQGPLELVQPAAPPPPPPPPPTISRPTRPSWTEAPHQGPSRPEPPRPPTPPRAEPARERKPAAAAGVGRKYAPFLILLVAIGAAGVYFGPDLFAPAAGGGTGSAPDTAATPSPAPVIPATEEALRGRAQERFLTATQAALRGLEPIPEVWLRGRYLAAPSDYPYVRETWQAYLATIREVRAGDDERYRQSYERALDDARIEESARASRLSGAVREFRNDAAVRVLHYDRVEALATVAIRAHDALLEEEGTIMYEPATGPAVSADPVIEAVGRDPEAQALLEQVLDLILAEMQGPGGPGEASNVRAWVYAGILDAVAN